MNSTQTNEYAQYLINHQKSIKSKFFQIPFQSHLRFLGLGKTLDVGCGAGRNLQSLGSKSIGIDHNQIMIESCKNRGLNAFTTNEWMQIKDQHLGTFQSILFSHVAEHMNSTEFQNLLGSMLPLLRIGGKVVIICPQEKGYSSDQTHVEFMDFNKIKMIAENLELKVLNQYSFPFNEFVTITRKEK